MTDLIHDVRELATMPRRYVCNTCERQVDRDHAHERSEYAYLVAESVGLDIERLAEAWWNVVNEPEEGPYEFASDEQRGNAKAWAVELARAYAASGLDAEELDPSAPWNHVGDDHQP